MWVYMFVNASLEMEQTDVILRRHSFGYLLGGEGSFVFTRAAVGAEREPSQRSGLRLTTSNVSGASALPKVDTSAQPKVKRAKIKGFEESVSEPYDVGALLGICSACLICRRRAYCAFVRRDDGQPRRRHCDGLACWYSPCVHSGIRTPHVLDRESPKQMETTRRKPMSRSR